MREQHPREDREQIDIVYELPPSAQSTYQYERDDGTIVHGDASGEWLGEAETDPAKPMSGVCPPRGSHGVS